MNFRVWIRAIRLPFFTATIVPIILGTVIAWYDTGSFVWMRFWLAMFGALFIHAGTNLANDYFDHLSGCDEINFSPTPFSGGSRVIQNGLIEPHKILYASLVSFILGIATGLYLNFLCKGNIVFLIGIIGVSLGFFYTIKSFRIAYGGFGELAVGAGFGPLMMLGSYYVQAQSLSFKTFLISIPVGILIALVIFINEFPDYAADKLVDKKTMVVILGKKKAVVLYHILLATIYLFITVFVIFRLLPPICLIVFLSLPLALKAFLISRKNFDKIYELLPANASTIGLHSAIGVLLSIGIVLDRVF
jgi:1,4-dihydroxy-2-naphthoate octaprenyltransferase